ncbi:hypothetical protein [Mucilaginibacter sp.]|uniref:hypothetical protein n=1 Tax=Mucilaginibacter sp. TaxID=1882438 RepID=UPI0035BC3397
MQDNINAQNAAVKQFWSETLQAVKNRYMAMVQSTGRSGDGLDSLKGGTRKSYGEIDSMYIRFNRYLVWLHKGAGKGKGGSKGSTWTDKNGIRRRTNPASFGKMNTGSRHAEEWLNPVMDKQLPKLADIVAGFKADAAVNQIQIK